MIHMQMRTKFDQEGFDDALLKSWEDAVVHYAYRFWSAEERTRAESSRIDQWREYLESHIPKKYTQRACVIAQRAGWMGETIYLFDRKIRIQSLNYHAECGKYDVISGTPLFCFHCQKEITSKDLAQDF
jgi:hypothetical protein